MTNYCVHKATNTTRLQLNLPVPCELNDVMYKFPAGLNYKTDFSFKCFLGTKELPYKVWKH